MVAEMDVDMKRPFVGNCWAAVMYEFSVGSYIHLESCAVVGYGRCYLHY